MSYRNQPTKEECDELQKRLIEKAPWKEFINCYECCFRKMCWNMKTRGGMKKEDIMSISDTFCPIVEVMEREFNSRY